MLLISDMSVLKPRYASGRKLRRASLAGCPGRKGYILSALNAVWLTGLNDRTPTAAKQLEQQDDESNDQQDVDVPGYDVKTDKSHQPKN